jgi:DNA-binding NarL/FixJ family response regulator
MISPKTLSVLVVHHAPVTRFGLTTLLKSNRGFKVVAETNSAPVARRLFAEIQPDLVILGLTLQHGDGISLLRDFRKMNRAARTLVLTAREDPLSVQRAFRAGACGYVVAQDEASEVLHALERIVAGELYASATVGRRFLQMLAGGLMETPRDPCAHLSDRELQVFRLIGSGLGTSRVAKELQLSVKTIETHREHIKQKLGLIKGMELTRQAAEWMLAATRSRVKHSGLLLLTIANHFGFELVKLHEDVFQSADASLVMTLL